MPVCNTCLKELPMESFQLSGSNKSGRDHRCSCCKREAYLDRQRTTDIFVLYCETKKSECRKKKLPFDLTPEYLRGFGREHALFLVYLWNSIGGRGKGSSRPNQAHLDRFIPELGYIQGNVAWLSGRANRIKYDASISEIKALLDWMMSVTTS